LVGSTGGLSLVAEEDDAVAEGPGLGQPKLDLGLRRPEQGLARPMTTGWT